MGRNINIRSEAKQINTYGGEFAVQLQVAHTSVELVEKIDERGWAVGAFQFALFLRQFIPTLQLFHIRQNALQIHCNQMFALVETANKDTLRLLLLAFSANLKS